MLCFQVNVKVVDRPHRPPAPLCDEALQDTSAETEYRLEERSPASSHSPLVLEFPPA